MPGRTASGNDSLQDPASSLGERADPDQQKDSAPGAQERSEIPREARGLVSPDCKSQLSVDDCALGGGRAVKNKTLLPGLVPDAVHRSAAIHGVDLFDLDFLSGLAARVISRQVVSRPALSSLSDGSRNRPHRHQYASRAGSAAGKAVRVRPYSEISRRVQKGQSTRQQLSPWSGLGAVGRTADRLLLRRYGVLRDRQRKLHHRAVSGFVRPGLLVHGINVSAAGTICGHFAECGDPYQTVSGRCLKFESSRNL